MNETIQNLINFRSQVITCATCGKVATRNHKGGRNGFDGTVGGYTNVTQMYSDGQRYYGSPLRAGSIIIKGDACGSCVRAQAGQRNEMLNTFAGNRNYDTNPLRVNEMP
jgi:2-keto-4-pentenoate hydratase